MIASPARRARGHSPHAFAALLAVVSAGAALGAAIALDLPLRDPDNAAGPLYVRLPAIVALLVALDVLPRAVVRRRRGLPLAAAMREVLAARWSGPRVRLVIVGLACFYLTYVGYRNLKGFLPFAREGTADAALLALDGAMGFGSAPATLLHVLLGTGIAAHVLSVVYVAFLAFVPLSLGASLVWSRQLRSGYLYVTVLCLNWLLGALSYYLLPSLGPVFAQPELFSALPPTPVSELQAMLESDRRAVLDDPRTSDRVHGIAGFASLHVAIVFSAALVAHLLRLPVVLRAGLWAFLLLTVLATIYFGWHYLVDDAAGLIIGAAAVWLGALATGHSVPLPPRPAWTRAPIGERPSAERVSERRGSLLRVAAAVVAVGLLLAVLIARQGEVVARGNLHPAFDDYEVERVRIGGVELYVDRSSHAGDALTALALLLAAAVLLIAARRLSGPTRRAFQTAGAGASFLAADDLLSAHETIGHNLASLVEIPLVDHPDDAVLAVYAVVAAGFLWRQRALARGTPRGPWLVAGIAAALAVGHDVSPLHLGALEETLEVLAAGAGLIGVIALARTHVRAACREAASTRDPGPVGSRP